MAADAPPPPFSGYQSYIQGFTTPVAGAGPLNEYQEKTRQVLFQQLAEAEKQRSEQLKIYYEQLAERTGNAQKTYTDALAAMAEFAKAGAMAADARGEYLGGVDSPLAQRASAYLFSASDPAALAASNKEVANNGAAAAEAARRLAGGTTPVTPQLLLDQTQGSIDTLASTLRDGVGLAQDPATRIGTARDLERQILHELERVAAASGLDTAGQTAYMQAVRQRIQAAALDAVPADERAHLAETREAAGQLFGDMHAVANTLRTAGGDSAKARALDAAATELEELNSYQAQMQRQQLYESMVSPELDALIMGYRRELDAMTGGAVDPLLGALSEFAAEHPWYEQYAQAMHFPDHAFAANWLVKRPEIITQMDSYYKANADLFSRARHNLDAERELRSALKTQGQELRQAGEGSPAFQVNPIVRTLDDMFRRKQLDELPDTSSRSWGSAFSQGYEEEEAKRRQQQDYIANPPKAEEAATPEPKAPSGAPKAPEAPLAPAAPGVDPKEAAAYAKAKAERARAAKAAQEAARLAEEKRKKEEEDRKKKEEEARAKAQARGMEVPEPDAPSTPGGGGSFRLDSSP